MLVNCEIELKLKRINRLEDEPFWKFEERCESIVDAITALLEEGGNEVESTTLKFGKVY